MRISSSTIYDSGTSRMTELQLSMEKSMEMISSGKRVLTAADDPVAAARALEITQGQSLNNLYATNRNSVVSNLGQEDNILAAVGGLMEDAKILVVNAGDGAIDPSQLRFMATELQGKFDEMLSQANSRDAIGNYVFGGFQTNTQPFTLTTDGVAFTGDSGERFMQVASTRKMAMSDSGQSVFGDMFNGNGNFVTGPTAPYANTGTALISPGSLAGTMSSDQYKVVFSNDGSGLTYSVFNVTQDPSMSDTPESTGLYAERQAIKMDNDSRLVEFTGTPEAGDSFDVNPSTKQSIFSTLQDVISALKSAEASSVGRTQLAASLSIANQNIDNSLDNILTIRASVGSRLKELDNLDSDGDARNQVFATTLRDLTDLDYAQAISDLSQQTTTLEAAQKSFLKVTGLSLFNYI